MGKRKEEGRERRKYNNNKEEEDITVMCVRGKNIKWVCGGGEKGAGIGKRGKVTRKYININSEYDFYSNINNRHK